ncbi:MAG: hydroxyacylglutathione hydrolase, partial [Rhodospirillales bacterium]|nr:hydroxyacylglutathione hydrolase [Rhodospirillales bacterium]
MTVTATPVPILSDNYAWRLVDSETGAVAIVDPADAKPIIAALEQAGKEGDTVALGNARAQVIET